MSSKKRTTIFRQLMLSVMVPVVFLIALISVLNFYEKKADIAERRKETIGLIHDEIEELLTFFDLTLVEIEKEMGKEGERFAKILANDVFPDSENIETINLDSVRKAIGMSPLQDIYIVDTNETIINTTYPPDLGLNFLAISDFFIEHFAKIREAQDFVEDRISIEMTTKKPKKYMYHATKDKKYIIEFGFYSDPATALVEHFINKLDSLPKKYEGIDTVSLYFGTNGFKSYQGHIVPQRDSVIANRTLMTGEKTSNTIEANNLIYTSEYSLIKMEESILHTGYVLRIIHNDGLVRELIKEELKGFLINLVIFVVPIFALILWRARVLSKPISHLVKTMNEVQSGDLKRRATVSGNNEVTELSEHFNAMISELQESHATLEQKVEDRTAELREQKHMVEEAHKEITDSIKYAKRLQDAILPPINLVQKYLPESFILFQPKDVVSGDFYWFEPLEKVAEAAPVVSPATATLLLAAADCTGHGVPGAMVSVVCSNALHRTVNEFGITQPSKILDKTRSLVIETFAKSDREVKDGMDISLVALVKQDNGNMHITWCGANNPLWLVKRLENLSEEEKNDPDILFGEEAAMIELKPNKQPVGLYAGMKDFQQQEVVLKPGDLFYLFTDGYADQFGGDKGKKMKYRPFKEKLLELSRVDLAAQREILATNFVNWRGDFEQIDDVCVIGVRI